jgi:type IV secretory pathway VirJ component
LLLIGFFIVLLLAVIVTGGLLFLSGRRAAQTVAQNTSTTTQAAVVPAPTPAPTPVPAPPSQTTVEVTPPVTTTTTTTTTAPPVQPQPQPQPVTPPQPKPQPKPQPQLQPHPADTTTAEESEPADNNNAPEDQSVGTSFPTYTEGGSKIANESAINVARMQLRNVKQVALIGTGGHAILMNQLAQFLRDEGLTVVDGADVVIYFNASNERLRLGRKRRSAEVTITRHGRPVLRYLMPAEEYRVGDNPAEAFARIASDIFNR